MIYNIQNTDRIGEMLRTIRQDTGLRQADMAEKLSTSQTQICFFETGKAPLKIDTLSRIAQALGGRLEVRIII
jgi:UDP-N-acetylglucosamine 1-carboxyvinyltransferase